MDIKEIKSIVDLMKRSGLTEFQLEEKDFKIRICRRNEDAPAIYQAPTPAPFPVGAMPMQQPPAPAEAATETDESKLVKSPMVGTFYTSPSPGSPPFVAVGDKVRADTVVCILEAMKVMNEITADKAGVIDEILVQNGESVEYGQPLFRLK